MTTAGPLGEIEPRTMAVLSGAVTGLTGAAAYFLVPLVAVAYGDAGQVRNTVELSSYVFDFFFARSLLYHVGVLVLVPFVTTAGALTLARRAGYVGRATDMAIVTGVVGGPVVTVWLGSFVALVAIAFQAPAIAVFGTPVAAVIAVVLSAGVAIVVTISAAGGYVLVERVGPRAPDQGDG